MIPRRVVSGVLPLFAFLAIGTPALAVFSATDCYLPSTGRGSGKLGSEWYTTIWVHNPTGMDATVQFTFLERDKSNTIPLVHNDTVPAGSVRKYNDAVFNMFGVEKFGAIRVVSNLRLVVVSRVYSQPIEGEAASVGQLLAGVPASFAIGKGEETSLIGVRQHSPAESWDFRYNYGLVETAGAAATVKVSAYSESDVFQRDKTVTLRPYEAKQWSVSDLLDGGRAWNWRLEVEVTDGSGKVIAFGAGTANSSNDPSSFEMEYKDSLLTENSGALTLPFTGAASNDNGPVFEVTNTSVFSGTGITGTGGLAGGHFATTDSSADATLGLSDTGGTGIWASGKQEGGYFEDKDGSGHAWVGRGDRGIEATGTNAGGAFWTPGDLSNASVATANSGIEAFGPEQGGIFGDQDQTSIAYVATGASGINAIGDEMGGWFAQKELTSEVFLARGAAGINAFGDDTGGYFQNTTDQAAAHLGHNGRGIEGFGKTGGGYFENSDLSGKAWLGDGDSGIVAHGDQYGGYFEDSDSTAKAWAAFGDRGVEASGNDAGGHFTDGDDGTWGTVAQGAASTAGNGAKNFVQNHPYDATRVIVYAAQEGDEVGTYTRGTARLAGGEARVPLGETFKWVTNPDIGLTVYVTPVGSWSQLYVAEKSARELIVRSAGGDPYASFDYVVMGLRIGFEESSVVREKRLEAPIPSMEEDQARYQHEPGLRQLSALERFKAMRRETGELHPLDLSASEALCTAIGRFRPDAGVVNASRSP